MSAYFVLTHTITDPERYRNEYIPGVVPFLTKYKADVLVADFEAKPLQGNPARGVVVIKFDSEQTIQDFLNDPGYKPVKDLRIAITSNASAVMAPEYKLPED